MGRFQPTDVCAAALIWALAGTSAAFAQTAPPPGVSQDASDPYSREIVVTATRRATGSQSVPLALTAIGGDELRDKGITNATELGELAPSLIVNAGLSAGSPRYALRGLSNNDLFPSAQAAVTTYIDDVAQNALYGVGASLFDLQRVEVLRGPQGTTFGKNATGGAIVYVSQPPVHRLEGYVSGRLGFGDQQKQSIEGAVNVPVLQDELAARFSFRAEAENDFLRNLGPAGGKVGAASTFSGRGQLLWTPTDDTRANLILYLARRNGDQTLGHAQIGVNDVVDKDVVYFSDKYDFFDDFRNRAATLQVEHDFGPVELTSISHYRHSRQQQSGDLDSTEFDLFYQLRHSTAEQYGQEFRLLSDIAGPISGLLGVYYEHSRIEENSSSNTSTEYGPFPGIALPQSRFPWVYMSNPNLPSLPLARGDQLRAWDSARRVNLLTVTDTYAVFGSVKAEFTKSLSITAGARKTFEKKKHRGLNVYNFLNTTFDFNQGNILYDPLSPIGSPELILPYQFRLKANPWTWDVTLTYDRLPDFLVFGRVARGFHAGNVNSAGGLFIWSPFLQNRAFDPPAPFDGEIVQSYELGIKTNPLRWLRINANVYHYDYTDQQVSNFFQGALQTANAASSKVDGAELEITAQPTERLTLRGSVSYTDARYSDYLVVRPGRPTQDNSGNRLNQAPKWSANWSAGYTAPVSANYDLRLGTNWSYRSRIFFDQTNLLPMSDPARFNGNARIGIEPSSGTGFSITAYVNNLTGVRPMVYTFADSAPDYYTKYFGIGRTFGLDLSYRW